VIAPLAVSSPPVDVAGMAPLLAPIVGSIVVLLTGLARSATVQRTVLPVLAVLTLVATGVIAVVSWRKGTVAPIVAGAITFDALTLSLTVLFCLAALATVLMSLRSEAVREAGMAEYLTLLLASVAGMVLLVA
jgi:NADH-quinone oxidoreductase subunit N